MEHERSFIHLQNNSLVNRRGKCAHTIDHKHQTVVSTYLDNDSFATTQVKWRIDCQLVGEAESRSYLRFLECCTSRNRRRIGRVYVVQTAAGFRVAGLLLRLT
jgi:hypothetical protein